jgi:hypothetical protein
LNSKFGSDLIKFPSLVKIQKNSNRIQIWFEILLKNPLENAKQNYSSRLLLWPEARWLNRPWPIQWPLAAHAACARPVHALGVVTSGQHGRNVHHGTGAGGGNPLKGEMLYKAWPTRRYTQHYTGQSRIGCSLVMCEARGGGAWRRRWKVAR